MVERLLIVKLVTLMLYAGPLLSGIAGHGWGMVPAFVSIFVVWQVVMRPADWPRTNADWKQPGAPAAVALRVLALVAVVAAMFGIGRGLGVVTDVALSVPVAVPVSLSFLAVPLGRLLWNPAEAARLEAEFRARLAAAQVRPEAAEGAAAGSGKA